MSLRTRLVWSISYILLAVIIALAIPLAIRLANRGTQELASDTLITAQTLGAYVGAENINRPDALERIVDAAPSEIERVVVTDLSGKVVYDSEGTATGENFANGLRPEIESALAGEPVAEVRYSATEGHDNMYAAAPIIDEQIVGSIRLTRSAEEVSEAARRTWIGLGLVGLAGLVAGIVLAFGLASSLARPLQRLAEAAHDLGEGDLSVRVGDIGGSAEVHEVAGSFDEMAERLERTVRAQREFVANASHQLRTPLTGMKLRIESATDRTADPDERAQLEAELTDLPSLEESLAIHERELAVLDNPKARVRMLEAEAAREVQLRDTLTKIEKNIERLSSDRNVLLMQLENYKDLDAVWAESAAKRDATAEAHRTFLANESLAGRLAENEKLFEAARMATEDFRRQVDDAQQQLESAQAQYDAERHAQERSALRQSEQKLAQTRATLDATRTRLEQLSAELARLSELRESLKTEFAEKERFVKVAETTTFIRETLREAAPRVARNYVHHVSVEACQMYREICGHADQTLCWSVDYGISLEEDGYERPFGNLSGGEQMAAALSVRLAILKQLSDIRIGFFDEPTTNMDAERRENLAQQISQIKNFDQLFVISHDDTFEGYVDNTLRVGN